MTDPAALPSERALPAEHALPAESAEAAENAEAGSRRRALWGLLVLALLVHARWVCRHEEPRS